VAERVERRVDDGGATSEVVRDVLGRREDRPVVELCVRLEEVPGGAGGGQVFVVADVASPDDPHAGLGLEKCTHRQRLGIVNHQDVVGAEVWLQGLGVLPVDRLEQLAIVLGEVGISFPVNQVV
jgi:hypothetical protein